MNNKEKFDRHILDMNLKFEECRCINIIFFFILRKQI